MSMPSFTKTYHHKPYSSISPTRPELSAGGKIVLITGAGSGVGEATAYAFAEAGAKVVVLCGRRVEPLNRVKTNIEAQSSETIVQVYPLDISDESNVNSVFKDVRSKCGPLDVVVNSAGHLSDKGTVTESSLSNFWDSFEVTCKGGFLIARAFLRNYNDKPGSDPILISMNSLLAHMPAPHVKSAPASYAASKVAQGKMIEYVASENEGLLRAYNLHPGTIITDMSTKSINMTNDPKATNEAMTWDDGI
jgi:NAD(P)-dependent dehydrogenase (short-subunit alcohol dehydrogenase family)